MIRVGIGSPRRIRFWLALRGSPPGRRLLPVIVRRSSRCLSLFLSMTRFRLLPQAELLRQSRACPRVGWRCQGVIGFQSPSRSILLGRQSVTGPDMPPKHLPTPAAVQTHEVLGTNRLPDGNSGGAILPWLRRFPGCCRGQVNGVDQRRNVGWCDLVILDVAADDFSDQ